MMANNTQFFADQTEQSAVKAHIVSSYFEMWARVIKKWNCNKMWYVDLFCGPGQYQNGSESTPIQIIRKALDDPCLTKKMEFIFNDSDQKNIENLKEHVAAVDSAKRLHIGYASEVLDVDTNVIVPQGIPILSFVDPFGYKGLTMKLINGLIANNGSDCIFFFNYNRINMALSSNTKFDEHLAGLFGQERTTKLKQELMGLTATEREKTVLAALQQVLTENNANYVLPFKFYGSETLRTSHFIIFVTKHPVACKLMKQVMYSNSELDGDGIATFSFENNHNSRQEFEQLTLLETPFQRLQKMIYQKYMGKTLHVIDICDAFDNDFSNFYIGKNVKEALRVLEEEGKMEVLDGRKRKYVKGKLTMPDAAQIHFLKLN